MQTLEQVGINMWIEEKMGEMVPNPTLAAYMIYLHCSNRIVDIPDFDPVCLNVCTRLV